MRRAPIRLACPACVGVGMEVATLSNGARLHHCGRCGGTWILRGQIERLRSVPASALRTIIRRADDAGFLCHDCHAPTDRDAVSCPGCGWANTLECPDCGKRMRRETHNGVTVDVCRPCKAVWLDHHELSSLWAVAAAGAIARSPGSNAVAVAGDAGGFLLDALWYAPDLVVGVAHVGVQAAGAGLEAASHLAGAGVHAAANAPEIVSGLAEVAGDAAGGVFSLIAEIIGGLFEGLG
jgi:Zn-finger nucleic acid-binding protein